MSKPLTLVVLFFSLLACTTTAVFAQTTAFTYQGSLQSGGAPANGNFDRDTARPKMQTPPSPRGLGGVIWLREADYQLTLSVFSRLHFPRGKHAGNELGH